MQKIVTQFQQSDSANQILPKIKQADLAALAELLDSYFNLLNKKSDNYLNGEPFVISDLGCGEGQMMEGLLERIKKNVNNFNKLTLQIYACDANKELLSQYEQRLKRLNIKDYKIEHSRIENCTPRKSDLIICSHSFYYNQSQWNYNKFNLSLENNIHTKLLDNLKQDGRLCVILQSAKHKNILEKNSLNENLAHNEAFEDIIYRIRALGNTNIQWKENKERETFTNAKIYKQNLNTFFKSRNRDDFNFQSTEALVDIDLGNVNFKLDESSQKYLQPPEVTELLNFYCRVNQYGYDGLTKEQQSEVLIFLQKHCTPKNGNPKIYHVNKVFVIYPKEGVLLNQSLINDYSSSLSRY